MEKENTDPIKIDEASFMSANGCIFYNSSENNSSLPAFSCMTKREYFAAHAPEMPEWFNQQTPEWCKWKSFPDWRQYKDSWSAIAKEWFKNVTGGGRYVEHQFGNGSTNPQNGPDDTITPFINDCNRTHEENKTNELKLRAHKLRSWRYYYADLMLNNEILEMP